MYYADCCACILGNVVRVITGTEFLSFCEFSVIKHTLALERNIYFNH